MKHTDFLIVGTGAAGLFCALQIPSDKQVLMITKEDADESDSFLAQGGICVLKSDDDYAFCAMKVIMTVILKIRCVPGTMKIEKNPSIL